MPCSGPCARRRVCGSSRPTPLLLRGHPQLGFLLGLSHLPHGTRHATRCPTLRRRRILASGRLPHRLPRSILGVRYQTKNPSHGASHSPRTTTSTGTPHPRRRHRSSEHLKPRGTTRRLTPPPTWRTPSPGLWRSAPSREPATKCWAEGQLRCNSGASALRLPSRSTVRSPTCHSS